MFSGSPFARFALVLLLALQFSAVRLSRADIVINEVVAGASDRLLQWDANGVPKLGAGTSWQAGGFNDVAWQTGTAPFAFGSFSGTTPVINTNVSAQMLNLTPTLYLRKSFTVSAADAAGTGQVVLNVTYNDGFVCYLNGVEVARRWAGPTNGFIYHDQPAYNPTSDLSTNPATQYTASFSLGAANTKLAAGLNVLSIQALNWSPGSPNFLIAPSLQITGGTTLVSGADTWKYFPGLVEPSGAFYDPALLSSGRLNVVWGGVNYDDSTWTAAVSPLRVGQSGNGTIIPTQNVVGVASTIYSRTVFTATAAQAADTQPMQFLIDYNDAFIAYINGVEVARANVGAANTFTPYNAVAAGTRNNTGSETTYVIDAPAGLLVAGSNVLSIQLVNVAANDSTMSERFDLKNNAGVYLVTSGAACKYFIGTSEPVGTGTNGGGLTDYGDTPDAPESAVDWVELYNNGTAAVSLNGWSLTDNSKTPAQWIFPNVSLPAGGYLVVICDGLNVTSPAGGGYLHANFSLSKAGEFLGLYNAGGAAVQTFTPALPPALPFYSYGRDTNGNYGYFDTPTPGTANAGTELTAVTADPTFSLAGGFYSGGQTVALTTATSGASIRYTTDGSEPTLANGALYNGALAVNANLSLRARAFATGRTPSAVVTNTYLINQSAALQSLPALCFTADQGRSLYRPAGVMAIYNNLSGNYNSGLWTANGDPTQYNNPSLSGEYIERPATLELFYSGTPPTGYGNVKTDFGLRITGSGYTAPRFLLTAQNAATNPNAGTWTDPNSGDTSTQKPSFDLYFRSDFGQSPLVAPLFPGSPISSFHDIRLRAGHNDANPFVQDEFVRRLWVSMGQVGSVGMLTSLYVDGVYKGYYNLCEHLREDFFQQSYHSTKNWDVRQVTDIASGDGIAFQDMITFVRTNSPAVLANYRAMQTKLDMNNFCDYLLLNAYCATQDWPTNNYIVSREHSSTGIHHYHVWDAEFSFGNIQGTVTSNSFTGINQPIYESGAASDTNLTDSISILYSLLKLSPEFRLTFADRVQKQMFNNGALVESNILPRWNTLKAQITPFLPYVNDRVTPWVNGTSSTPSRRQALFGYTSSGTTYPGHLVSETLWPATLAPTLSQFGGAVSSGYQLTLSNPNGVGTICYTVNGTDPRLAGGANNGTNYAGAIPISQTTEVKARVLNTNGEWSPLSDAIFTVATPPALAITELMYHPPLTGTNTVEDEFVELKNTGSTAINLSGMSFTSGITYTFPAGSTLAAGAFAVLVKDQAQFAAKYPNVPLAGVYTDGLSNGGETVTLADLTGTAVYSVAYANFSPWPVLADGYGNSLVPVSANANPDPNNAVNWRASAALGGSPGADDPTPTTPAVVVNEVLANSTAPQTDMVELYNPTTAAADISGWFLSDSSTTPQKFKIPAGTIIPAGGYLVYTEADFNSTPGVGTSFAFDANGEQVRLTAADSSGNLTGYSDGFSFGASSPGMSFGRYVNGVGAVSDPAQKAQTFGAANAGPLVGPVVITELMYHPVSTGDEFVEIRNISNQTVALYDPANPANTWKIDGIGFTFPAGTAITPGQIFLVVPLTESAWRAKYNPPAAVRVFGAYTGKQDNSGERISLQKPGLPYTDTTTNSVVVPYIDVDYVNYLPTAPWPVAANGSGPSLERINLTSFGDDPGNWRASPANGGSPGALPVFTYTAWNSAHFTPAQLANPSLSGPNADPDGDGLSNLLEYALGLDPLMDNAPPYSVSLAMDATSGPYVTLTYRRSTSTSGLTFSGDTTGDLTGAWTLGNAVQVGTAVNDGDGTETVVLRDTVPVTGATRRFIRLHVTSN